MSQQELWQWIHYNYGEDLGLTSDDDADYVSLSAVDRIQFQMRIQREEKLSQQNADSITHPVDVAAGKVMCHRWIVTIPGTCDTSLLDEIVVVMVEWEWKKFRDVTKLVYIRMNAKFNFQNSSNANVAW